MSHPCICGTRDHSEELTSHSQFSSYFFAIINLVVAVLVVVVFLVVIVLAVATIIMKNHLLS